MGPSSAGFALWVTTTELTELQLTCFCLSLLFKSKEIIYGTLQDLVKRRNLLLTLLGGKGGYNTMNDFGPKLKVGGEHHRKVQVRL